MPTTRKGRPLQGSEPKQTIGASIKAQTARQISHWRGKLPPEPKPHPGIVIDKLVEHGQATQFDPVTPAKRKK